MKSDIVIPDWLSELLGLPPLCEGQEVDLGALRFVVKHGILRSLNVATSEQHQTEKTFAFKWQQRVSFEGDAFQEFTRRWMVEKYGDVESYLPPGDVLLLDAGCGAAVSALKLFAPVLSRVRYFGVDVSDAVDVARERCQERGVNAAFVQCDLNELPIGPGTVDAIFSEGVLHHTNSTERALKALAPLLRPGGVFMFYVYRKKGPIREFTDDYVRGALAGMTPADAWSAVMPLTRLGKVLGDLNVEIDIPDAIDVLGIPAGRINLQRFFYWHVFKAYYRPDFSLDEMNHINFDWYAPANAHRQSPDDVRRWCADAGLEIEREVIEEAGITVVARKA